MANKLGHVVVLDPVGVGASSFRKQTAEQLLKEVRFDAIRGKYFRDQNLGIFVWNTGKKVVEIWQCQIQWMWKKLLINQIIVENYRYRWFWKRRGRR